MARGYFACLKDVVELCETAIIGVERDMKERLGTFKTQD